MLVPPDKTSEAGEDEEGGMAGRPITLTRLTVASISCPYSASDTEERDAGEATNFLPPSSFWSGNVHRYLSCVLALLQRFSLLATWPDSKEGEPDGEGPLSLYIR